MSLLLSTDRSVVAAAPRTGAEGPPGLATEASRRSVALHLTSSNRFETLLERLLRHMALPRASPLAPEHVVVPSVAVRRRIELAAADRFGICANVEFPFLAQWLWAQIAKVVPDVDESSPFAPPRLAWRIYRILGEAGFTAVHPALARYVAGADDLMRYELAVRVASLFDHYITYRQDWLAAWTEDRLAGGRHASGAFEHESWQAALWRRIARELGTARQHPSSAFFAGIRRGTVDASRVVLPEAVHVFCLPSIPPLYVEMLRELARWMEVHVYLLNPCAAFWEDIVAPRRMAELAARGQVDHHEVGNPLLAQWGAQTKANLRVTLEAWEGAAIEAADYAGSDGDTLLARVQRSILQLDELAPGTSADLRADDRSIEVHVCHSLTRELEVLHDQILGMFADDPSLGPGDVLVVTPALEEAASLIEAVFDNVPPARRIPYAITGRARATRNPAARALLDLVQVATSRFESSACFELLQQPIVARRFGIDAPDLEAIRDWIQAAGIRWGFDAPHRAAFGLPAMRRHTFADGLDRLLLGYALPPALAVPFGDLFPAGDAEGTAASALGAFARVVHAIERFSRELASPKSAPQWLRILHEMTDAFLAPVDEELEFARELQEALRALHADMSAGAPQTAIPVDVVRQALEAVLDDPARGGVPGGGVTFASMTSLRSLPYRVVCAIGLDDGAFPAADRPLEFDLIAAAPRAGDRQRRADDRNVFLDLLVAARARLYLSYTGRDIRDDTARPPSVVIDDLLEVLVRAVAADPDTPEGLARARARLVVEHPLQAFSPACFESGIADRLRSFNEEYCAALRHRAAAPVALASVDNGGDVEIADDAVREPARGFFASPLPAPESEWRTLTLDRLAQFFGNPCRYLLRERLGIVLPRGEEALADAEPFTADRPGRRALAARLMPPLLAGADAQAARAIARAGTEYPPGRFGEQILEEELVRLQAFAANVLSATRAPVGPPAQRVLEFVIDGAPWRLAGGFGDLRVTGRVRYRYDDASAWDYLNGWIEHLFLCACEPEGVAPITTWHSRDGVYRFMPVVDAPAHLETLVRHYADGLCRPLHFFPKSSWCFASTESRSAAEATWRSTTYRRFGEDRDAAYRLCLRGDPEPLDQEFERLAREVFGPLLGAIDDPRLER